jgi:hypothetical protein
MAKKKRNGTVLRLKKMQKILQPFEKSITYKMSQTMNSVRLPDRHPLVSPIDSNTNM